MLSLALLLAFAADWQPLIQPNSFAGWRSPSGHTPIGGAWTIEKGVLTVKPFVQRRTDLWSAEEYANFELEWEWKATRGANSGVKFWVRDGVTLVVEIEDQKWHRVPDPRAAQPDEITLEYTQGLEYQMADDAHEPDAQVHAHSRAGALYGLLPPSPENARPHGEWNRSRLLVNEGRFEHWLNGKLVNAYDLAKLEAAMPPSDVRRGRRKGPIALQYHQTEVAFRKMRIRRLP